MKLLEINHVEKSFDDLNVLKDISLSVEDGEIVSIIGPSGSGKSTLLRCINKLETQTSGKIRYHGKEIGAVQKEINDYRSKVGMVFQSFNLFNNMTVLQNCMLCTRKVLHLSKEEAFDRAITHLKQVGMAPFINANPTQLSGGQKQRVAIARALASNPKILLCDEATSALDPQTTESILKLLKKINKEMGVTILLITHQMQVVQMICNKVAVMENGKVVESGRVLDVFGKPQALVTKRFVQTVINDQIPESIVSLVKEQKEHFQVERLKFIGSSVNRPVISDICQVEGIVVNILGATVQELQENVMCVFILQLIGSEDKICEAEKQIDANGVIRERVEVI